MFGGDEVSSLVFDLGTFNHRIGYSGEDSPKCVYQPLVGENSGK
jgi:actin-related protein